MEYMTIQDASDLWDISSRRIQKLCSEGRLEGAIKFGRQWAIPTTTEKPEDARIKSGKYVKNAEPNIDAEPLKNENRSDTKREIIEKPGFSPEDVLEQIGYFGRLEDLIPEQQYDFVDMFCGAGGMSYGFHRMAELTGKCAGCYFNGFKPCVGRRDLHQCAGC